MDLEHYVIIFLFMTNVYFFLEGRKNSSKEYFELFELGILFGKVFASTINLELGISRLEHILKTGDKELKNYTMPEYLKEAVRKTSIAVQNGKSPWAEKKGEGSE